jgi:PKD repeat protein
MKKLLVLLGVLAAMAPAFLLAQTAGTNQPVYCPFLTTALQLGARDGARAEVSELQKFLADFFGLNRFEYVTGYFGQLTRENVRKFQCQRMGVCSGGESTTGWGLIGQRTRTAIANACGGVSLAPAISPVQTCAVPWGGALSEGQSLTAYARVPLETSSTQYRCVSEQRTCTGGVLSGSYVDQSCVVANAVAERLVVTPSSGLLPLSVSFSGNVNSIGYSIDFGDGTTSGSIGCEHGACPASTGPNAISVNHIYQSAGTYTAKLRKHYASNVATCTGVDCTVVGRVTITVTGPVIPVVMPPTPAPVNCSTPWGATVAQGASVTAYSSSHTPSFGQSVEQNFACATETRTCINGVLSGTYQLASCPAPVNADGSCQFHHIKMTNGSSINAFKDAYTAGQYYGYPCTMETRVCRNGVLSGTFKNISCSPSDIQAGD